MAASVVIAPGQDPFPRLREAPVFAKLPDPALKELAQVVDFSVITPGERVQRPQNTNYERYGFILEGQLAIAIERGAGPDTRKFFKNRSDRDVAYLDFLAPGDFYSDAYLPEAPDPNGARLECVGLMTTLLAHLPRPLLARLMRAHPAWAEEMHALSTALRQHHRLHKRTDLQLAQDFFLRYGYSFATTLKVIDLERCIGCNACEDACTSRHGTARLMRHGPVLGLLAFPVACRTCVDHRCVSACGFDAIAYTDAAEVRVDTKKCVGCTACQAACPNDVITMVKTPYTGADFPNAMPDTDPNGQSNVPGLYLVGEASGDALIKVAINSGKKAIDHLVKELQPGGAPPGVVDVIIAGSGPSGLSAALTAKAAGLSYLLLDKGTIASTIQNYPRHKVVMAEPAHIPLFGDLWLKDTTKEELIEKWNTIITQTGLDVRTGEEVKGVEKGPDGVFTVTTSKGKHQARRVVLATGTRGAPRKIGCPGESAPRVQYQLTEPADFAGKQCLVIGGGDSAVEAAMSLAEIQGTTVTLSYRRDSFGRIKARNKSRLEEFEKIGKVTVILKSTCTKIEGSTVTLAVEGEAERVFGNDAIFALLGAEPPTKFFQKCGIKIIEPATAEMEALAKSRGDRYYASKCDHCTGHEDQACITACPTEAIFEIPPTALFPAVVEATKRGNFDSEAFVKGLPAHLGRTTIQRWAPRIATAGIAATGLIGLECFLRTMLPEYSGLYLYQGWVGIKDPVTFSSAAGLGFNLGIIGSVMMALTALYPLHSRLGWFKKVARTRFWMAAHILFGILGPAFVTYHTKLKLDRWPTIAFFAMWAVVFSGVLGRYLYTYFRRGFGLVELEGRSLETDKRRVMGRWDDLAGKTQIFNRADAVAASGGGAQGALAASAGFLAHQAIAPFEQIWLKHVTLRHVPDRALRYETARLFAERSKNGRKAEFMKSAEQASGLWRNVHLACTVILFVVAILHIVFAMLFKAT
ncbi:MAG: NAD(P)-binding domain-containing protein [Deltaproteobacteria bacterium]|nr:NAD(P)-binding domain-containing protein [Deltaproteobacteria bacterium]